ncbi:c-type cytochrome [Pseudoduganella violaceinigra]|uniref:c-type cytochrome n=1 Tax=Pseudoduganella violaceinigra TaxID=246602 RepID=UPI0009FE2AD1|nr:c-type cytochrome [Pseudoduganella violaceinigra]
MKASLMIAIAAAILAPAAMAGAPAANGEKIYTANCASCHSAGVLGAPKFGDKVAWAPRVKQGKEVLYTHGLNGFKMMPPKGGNPGLKDDEVKAAIDYMAKS